MEKTEIKEGVKLVGIIEFADMVKDREKALGYILQYCEFFKSTLHLGQFVPCVDGVTVEKPSGYEGWREVKGLNFESGWAKVCKQFEQAQKEVVFVGCTAIHRNKENNDYYIIQGKDQTVWLTWNDSKTVQDMIQYGLKLTNEKASSLGLIK